MIAFLRDLHHTGRTLARQWKFTATVVLTLALGVGATTLVYAAVNRVMLHPLPFKGEARLVYPWRQSGPFLAAPSIAVVDTWRRTAHSLDGLQVYAPERYDVSDGQHLRSIDGVSIEPGFLAFLGLTPLLGRSFSVAEVRQRDVHAVLLSYGYWQRAYGGRHDIIGQTIRLDSSLYAVIGVMPKRLALFSEAQVWTPLAIDGSDSADASGVLARLRPSVTIEAAERELRAIASRVPNQRSGDVPVVLKRPQDSQDASLPRTLWVLMGVVTLVLVIACTNVVLLLLARAAEREQETAVRVSLGAGRWQLVRPALAETAMLAILGDATGVLLAWSGMRGLSRLSGGDVMDLTQVTIDNHVLLFALTLTAAVAVVTAAVPALRATAVSSDILFKAGAIHGSGRRAIPRLHSIFVIMELALSLVLLVGLGLLVRSLVDRERSDLGFRAEGLLTVRITLPPSQYPSLAARDALAALLLEKVRALPQVRAATVAAAAPPHYGVVLLGGLEIEGATGETSPAPRVAALDEVGPDYFRVAGIKVERGRAFTREENRDRANVIMLSQGLAERIFPGREAVGQRVRRRGPGDPSRVPWSTVVGVVQNVAAMGIQGQLRQLQWYEPYGESSRAADGYLPPLGTLVVRASGDADALALLLRNQVRSVDPALPPPEISSVSAEYRAQLAAPRFITVLLAIFAVLAVLLAVVGLFGLLSYAVGVRVYEIGIRLALGAEARDVRALVVRQGMTHAFIGLLLGAICAFFATKTMTALLYGVTPRDVGSFVAAFLILAGTAFLACYFPARRATRVDPMVVLRD